MLGWVLLNQYCFVPGGGNTVVQVTFLYPAIHLSPPSLGLRVIATFSFPSSVFGAGVASLPLSRSFVAVPSGPLKGGAFGGARGLNRLLPSLLVSHFHPQGVKRVGGGCFNFLLYNLSPRPAYRFSFVGVWMGLIGFGWTFRLGVPRSCLFLGGDALTSCPF